MTKTDAILVKVPVNLKKELQIIAIKNNTNMSDIIRELIEDYIQQNKI